MADNETLMASNSKLEITKALFFMHPDKSLDLDGMYMAFFQKYWHIVGSEVSSACLSVLTHNIMPNGFNDTHIVLIPKKQPVETMGDLRPISPCNVIYKIMAKVLANRLRKVRPTVVSHIHGAFIKGRSIMDNNPYIVRSSTLFETKDAT